MTDRNAAVGLRILAPRANLLGTGDADSLVNVNTTELPNGASCWVNSSLAEFRLRKNDNSTPPDNINIVKPCSGPGRWFINSGSIAPGGGIQVQDQVGLTLPPRPIVNSGGLHPVDTGVSAVLLNGEIDVLAFPTLATAAALNPGFVLRLLNTTYVLDADITDPTVTLTFKQSAIVHVPANRTIAAKCDFTQGGIIVVAAGVRVRHEGPIVASDMTRIWDVSAAGSGVDVAPGVVPHVTPYHFGAIDDGVTDNAVALHAMTLSVRPASSVTSVGTEATTPIHIPEAKFGTSEQVKMYGRQRIYGVGPGSVLKTVGAFPTNTSILVTDVTGQVSNNGEWQGAELKSLAFESDVDGVSMISTGTNLLTLNSRFEDLWQYTPYGLQLTYYAQANVIRNIHAHATHVEQVLHLQGNFNLVEFIDKEGGAGLTTVPLILIEQGAGGLSNGNILRMPLTEAGGRPGKPALGIYGTTNLVIESPWDEVIGADFGFDVSDSANLQIKSKIYWSTVRSAKFRNSTVFIDYMNGNSEDVAPATIFDIDAASLIVIDTALLRRNANANLLSYPQIRINRSLDATIQGGAAAAVLTSADGSYPTGFAGGETMNVTIDAGTSWQIGPVNVVFQGSDQTHADVVARINTVLGYTAAATSTLKTTLTGRVLGPDGNVQVNSADAAVTAATGFGADSAVGTNTFLGYSPVRQQYQVTAESLLDNQSFEAEDYAWTVSGAAATTETYPVSEVSAGLMFQSNFTADGIDPAHRQKFLTQNYTINAERVGRAMTLSFLAKFEGAGFLAPVVQGCGITLQTTIDRALDGFGWQLISCTFTPQSAGAIQLGVQVQAGDHTTIWSVDDVCLSEGIDALQTPGRFQSLILADRPIVSAAAAPTTGTFPAGSLAVNSAPSLGEPALWSWSGSAWNPAAPTGVIRVCPPLTPDAAYFPSSAFAGGPTSITVSGSRIVQVLTYDDSVNQSALWTTVVEHYAGGDLKVKIQWYSASATTGDVAWFVQTMAMAPGDADAVEAHTLAFGGSTIATVLGTTAGRLNSTTVTITGLALDSLANGDTVWLRLTRVATDPGDTMVGDAKLLAIIVENP